VQGQCAKYQLDDISQSLSNSWPSIVPNDETSSVVMYIAPGPPSRAPGDRLPAFGDPTGRILYVAATRSTVGLPAYRDLVPAVCMRNSADFDLVSWDWRSPSKVRIKQCKMSKI